jgi:hypothetical protein
MLSLFLVSVVLSEDLQERRISLLLILQSNLLQFAIEQVLLEEKFALEWALFVIDLQSLDIDWIFLLIEVEFEEFGDRAE